jgi:hypothetical protein
MTAIKKSQDYSIVLYCYIGIFYSFLTSASSSGKKNYTRSSWGTHQINPKKLNKFAKSI